MIKDVTRITRYQQSYILEGVNDAGGKERASLADVRAAVVAPEEGFPCYYLVLGVYDRPNILGVRRILYINEHSDGIEAALRSLKDDITRLSIQKVYADSLNQGFYYSVFKEISGTDAMLSPAASTTNVHYGDALIAETVKNDLLRLPVTKALKVRDHVNAVNEMDFSDKNYAPYFAWTALRYLLAGFKRDDVPKNNPLAHNETVLTEHQYQKRWAI